MTDTLERLKYLLELLGYNLLEVTVRHNIDESDLDINKGAFRQLAYLDALRVVCNQFNLDVRTTRTYLTTLPSKIHHLEKEDPLLAEILRKYLSEKDEPASMRHKFNLNRKLQTIRYAQLQQDFNNN